MTILVCYPSKKNLKEQVGQFLNYKETSFHGPEFTGNGKFIVAYRPSVWRHPAGGREFFATVVMVDGKINKVE